MRKLYRSKLKPLLTQYRRQSIVAGTVLSFAVIGLVLMALSNAATTAIALEAEAGTLSGNTAAGQTAGASGDASVKFGLGTTNPNPPTPPPPTGGQTLGCGGVTTPSGATLTTSDSDSELEISSGGTEGNPKVYDGQCHTVGTITIRADYVVVQNFKIQASSQDGINSDGTGITMQNNEIKGVHEAGDGDMNAIEFFGNDTTIAYNTAIDFVEASSGCGSHTDAIQTWVSSSHPVASSNVTIKGNKFTGPANPDRDCAIPSIHQCIMVEGEGLGGNSGGSGNPSNWLIADNYFADSWNQCIKLDGVDGASITRNEFAGSSDRVMEVTSASSDVKFYDDNVISGDYGSTPDTVPGPGPTSL